MTKHQPVVTLARPGESIDSSMGSFARGERLIMVDGVCWGRTRVRYQGCHGTTNEFIQRGGETLGETSQHGYFRPIKVRSQNARSARSDKIFGRESTWKPTEQLVQEKAQELVQTGLLRDPELVAVERNKRIARIAAAEKEEETRKEQELRARAMEALRANDPDSELVQRVVDAMRWAQSL